ncbi:MAG: efflux RND transporter periplasmic adaptor subunit [Planctomycetota bacterium]
MSVVPETLRVQGTSPSAVETELQTVKQNEAPSQPDAEVLATLRKGTSSSPKQKLLIGGVLLLVGAVAVVVLKHGMQAKPTQYATDTCQQGDLTVTVTATGTLDPTNVVEVGCEISGTIRTVEVDFNDHVQAGDLLLTLDTRELDAVVAKSKASLQVRQAELRQAEASRTESQRTLVRLQELRARNAVTEQDIDTAVADVARSEARVASSRAQVSVAEATLDVDLNKLEKARIFSPIDGIVLDRNVEPGQTIAATFQTPILLTICEDLGHMKLKIDVDEADVGGVSEGLEATFTVDAYPDERFPATISSLRFAAHNNQDVVTYEAVLEVENPELKLRPGMTAVADVVTSRAENALLVSNAALRFQPLPEQVESTISNADSGETKIWTLSDNKPVPLFVTTGLTDGRYTEILSDAIQAGTPLVVDILP